MFKKTITYTDYNGVAKTEDHYFNLNKAELLTMNLGTSGGLEQKMDSIAKTQDVPKMLEFFEELIKKSYGIRTPEGRFVKKPEYFENFYYSEAYSEFITELLASENSRNAVIEFMTGIVPEEMAKAMKEQMFTALPKE